MRIEPFRRQHVETLMRQSAMAWLQQHRIDYGCLEGPMSFSVFDRSGAVQACLGLIEHWAGRAEAWAMLGAASRPVMPAMHKAVLQFLDKSPFQRIDAAVPADFDAAHRWVRMLGFECEAPLMRGYLPGGKDAALYARTK